MHTRIGSLGCSRSGIRYNRDSAKRGTRSMENTVGECFIIAEGGVNHNGQVDLALALCDAAKRAGANAIKFQTFKTDALLTAGAKLARYQRRSTASDNQRDLIRPLELGYEDFVRIKSYAESKGLHFLSTPDEDESLEFLVSLGLRFIKIGSGELDNIPFLRHVGSLGVDVILSTGMGTLGEVETAIHTLEFSGAGELTLLHCTSEYPCPYECVNLRAMQTLQHAFGLPVGYSDHTMGTAVPVAAVALGATVLEKHLTLDRSMVGPDHSASLEPADFADMVAAVRQVEVSLGSARKQPCGPEIATRSVVRKSIVAARPIRKGQTIRVEDLVTKRCGIGLSPTLWDRVVGSVAQRDYQPDEPLDVTIEIGCDNGAASA